MKLTTKLFLWACGWTALTLPFYGLSAASSALDGKPRFLVVKLGRGQLNQLWLEASVENVKGALIVDTGAESTVFSQDKFGFLLRGPDRKLPLGVAATARVNSLTAKSAFTRDFRLGGNDLGGMLVSLVGDRFFTDSEVFHYQNRRGDFDGLLGENFLRSFRAVVDCHRQLLYLSIGPVWKDNLATVLPANGWTRVPMAEAGKDFTVPCAINGHRFRLVVDTGSPFTHVDDGLIQVARLASHDLPLATRIIGNEATPTEMVHAKELQIGDYTASDVRLTTAEHLRRELGTALAPDGLPTLGLLGGDTLGFNGAIIDVGEHALYLKPL